MKYRKSYEFGRHFHIFADILVLRFLFVFCSTDVSHSILEICHTREIGF